MDTIERACKIEELIREIDNMDASDWRDIAMDAEDDKVSAMSDMDLIDYYNRTFDKVGG